MIFGVASDAVHRSAATCRISRKALLLVQHRDMPCSCNPAACKPPPLACALACGVPPQGSPPAGTASVPSLEVCAARECTCRHHTRCPMPCTLGERQSRVTAQGPARLQGLHLRAGTPSSLSPRNANSGKPAGSASLFTMHFAQRSAGARPLHTQLGPPPSTRPRGRHSSNLTLGPAPCGDARRGGAPARPPAAVGCDMAAAEGMRAPPPPPPGHTNAVLGATH